MCQHKHLRGDTILCIHPFACLAAGPAVECSQHTPFFYYRRLFTLRENTEGGGAQWQRNNLCMGDTSTCIGGLVGEERERFVLSFGEDEDGELYILTTSNASPLNPVGVVYSIVDPAR